MISLRRLTGQSGTVAMVALDHRDAFRNAFRRAGVTNVTSATMLEVKCRIAGALARHATAIMLDPEAARRCRPAGLGLVVPLEAQGHAPHDGGRLNRLADDFSPADASSLGADGAKLLLYYRADHAATAAAQRELVQRTAAECHRYGLALIVEPLVYRLEHEPEDGYRQAFQDLVVSAARDIATLGPDLLKLQYPSGADEAAACAGLTEAAAPRPWTLLGGSDIDGDAFARQFETACHAGASGFIAGRAIWSGALGLSASEQDRWLATEAQPLFEQLVAIAVAHARPVL